MHDGITIAELPIFEKWAVKGLTEDDRAALSEHLAYNPAAGDLIPGSGGLRKLRWAKQGKGKRGGIRIIYYFYDTIIPLYLITGYAKSVKDDLSDAELAAFRKLVEVIKAKARANR